MSGYWVRLALHEGAGQVDSQVTATSSAEHPDLERAESEMARTAERSSMGQNKTNNESCESVATTDGPPVLR